MKNISQNEFQITHHIYSLVVPKEMLQDFDIDKVEESDELLLIHLTEKLINVPQSTKELVLNGYMNAQEIQGFPVQGKSCYYNLRRRRWKEKGTQKDLFNSYNYAVEGSKTTPDFGAFLKEIGM